jgi:glycosyltransferase involved in cell wall biosynthesis
MGDKKPTISIITVVFNGVQYLEATIRSIIDQECKDFEYIIVDGGSTDGTIDIIRKYENHINRWISEPDKGLYDAMNKGMQLATGEYLWFINAGDEIYNSSIIGKILTDELKSADILYGEALIIDKNRNEIGMRRQKVPEILNWQSLNFGMVVSHQSFLVRRSIAPQYNIKYQCSADIDWVIISLKIAEKIINTKLILSRFMDGGRSKHTILTNLTERFQIMVNHYGLFSTIINHLQIAGRFFLFILRNRRF